MEIRARLLLPALQIFNFFISNEDNLNLLLFTYRMNHGPHA